MTLSAKFSNDPVILAAYQDGMDAALGEGRYKDAGPTYKSPYETYRKPNEFISPIEDAWEQGHEAGTDFARYQRQEPW